MSKNYVFTGTVTISVSTEVVAESEEEAHQIAFSRGFCPLGQPERHGSNRSKDWCHSGEIDGSVENVVLDSAV